MFRIYVIKLKRIGYMKRFVVRAISLLISLSTQFAFANVTVVETFEWPFQKELNEAKSACESSEGMSEKILRRLYPNGLVSRQERFISCKTEQQCIKMRSDLEQEDAIDIIARSLTINKWLKYDRNPQLCINSLSALNFEIKRFLKYPEHQTDQVDRILEFVGGRFKKLSE
jgi:hypothetical protein